MDTASALLYPCYFIFSEYQVSADNSYSVPSIYDVGKPGNFPSYNAIPAPQESYGAPQAQDNYAASQAQDTYGAPQPQENYGAPQEVYAVPIKVEETYKAAQPEKSPEVFYIFYENQEPATSAQV